jgi:hypothetical protein
MACARLAITSAAASSKWPRPRFSTTSADHARNRRHRPDCTVATSSRVSVCRSFHASEQPRSRSTHRPAALSRTACEEGPAPTRRPRSVCLAARLATPSRTRASMAPAGARNASDPERRRSGHSGSGAPDGETPRDPRGRSGQLDGGAGRASAVARRSGAVAREPARTDERRDPEDLTRNGLCLHPLRHRDYAQDLICRRTSSPTWSDPHRARRTATSSATWRNAKGDEATSSYAARSTISSPAGRSGSEIPSSTASVNSSGSPGTSRRSQPTRTGGFRSQRQLAGHRNANRETLPVPRHERRTE